MWSNDGTGESSRAGGGSKPQSVKSLSLIMDDSDDPWEWDVDRVVQELCSPNPSWHTSPTPLRFPPLDQMEKALREHEVDGEVLMTYDQAELCVELGMKILKHKSAFRNAVREIRARSIRYRMYLKQQASEFSDDIEDVVDPGRLRDVIRDKLASGAYSDSPGFDGSVSMTDPKAPTPDSTFSHITPDTSEPAPKKRKILPTLLTTVIDPNRNRKIATEADTVRFAPDLAPPTHLEKSHEEPAEDIPSTTSLDGAYLGPKSISRFDIVDERSDPHSDEYDGEINFVSTGRLIPGRLIQAHRLVKRRLLRRSGYRRSGFSKSDIVQGSTNPDHNEVLPLYGESDDEMDYDSDTWKEIEAEKVEREQNQTTTKGLTASEIESTFERVLAQMAADWKEDKLPKCAARANRIWNDARRSGLKSSIDRARMDLRDLDARIAKWKQTIEKNEYRNVAELEQSLSSFEPSVHDKEHRSWLIGVLTSPYEPAKVGRPRQQRNKRPKPRTALQGDEEVLTSDSEGDLQGFIVDDEPPLPDAEHPDDPDVIMADNDVSLVEPPQADLEASGKDHLLSGVSRNLSKTEVKEDFTEILRTPQKPKKQIFIDLTTSPDQASSNKGSKKNHDREKENNIRSSLIMGISDLTSSEQKVAIELTKCDQEYVNYIFTYVQCLQPEDIWLDVISVALDKEWPKAPYNTDSKRDSLTAYHLIRFFETWKDDRTRKLKRYKHLDDLGKQRLRELYTSFPKEYDIFISFLKRLGDRFEWTLIELPKSLMRHVPADPILDEEQRKIDDDDNDDASDMMDISEDDEKNESTEKPRKKKRKRKEIRDREAAIAREVDHAGAAEREHRRQILRERLLAEGNTALGSQQGGIIVNESKNDDQGFIYIHDDIAHRIKEHQVTGVRFMWDQLLVAKKRQGCLLAHTMGLGKTMQVITLLLTINEASLSDDPTVSSQIPKSLRDSRTLILCPATLVNNWMDEMLGWLPEPHHLGQIVKIDAVMDPGSRRETVEEWGENGGVLIVGYNLFKSFIEDGDDISDILLNWPNIVVADEAHIMKNPKSKAHVAAANFKTLSRIALTGSPLANNVEEYFSMINWVAPNYLGDIREFRYQYATPINHGLHVDSTSSERRNALRMLRVLKSEVAPKVSRITIRALKHDMPPKKEFVLTVPLTHVQRQAYEMFIEHHHSKEEGRKVPVFAIHDLSLICASPSIFLQKLKATKSDGSGYGETVILPQQLISNEMALLRAAERAAKDDFSLSWKIPILFEIIEQSRKLNDKLLLFSHSMVTLDYLEGALRMKKYSIMRLDGQTQMSERQNIINRFNKGNVDVFLISTRAGGLGLNITGANRVVIFDAQFNPQNEQQAVGRAYRIGQKKQVFVYRFVCGGTCEQKTLNQAIWKMQLASRVVDKKHPIPKAERVSGVWAMPDEPKQEPLDQHLGKDKVIDELLRQPKFREGIRAIQMMDIFEEEAIEDAELSAEDVALADQMILANEARRTGQPLPTHHAAHSTTSYQDVPYPLRPALATPMSAMTSSFPAHIAQSQVSQFPSPGNQGGTSTSRVLPHPGQSSRGGFIYSALGLPSRRPRNSPVPHVNPVPPVNTVPHMNAVPHMNPVQLRGAEVHVRPPPNSFKWAPDFVINLPAIQESLSRAFDSGAEFPDKNTRTRVARDIASMLWNRIGNETPQQQRALTESIIRAASFERFIEALCMGLISPQQLVQMTPELLSQQLEMWNVMDLQEWQTRKQSWISKQTATDPEHLPTALQRISMVKQDESGKPVDQSKSFRLDDREALQAVFELRGLRKQQGVEAEAPRASLEHKKTKDVPSGKEPRLPDWARNVVRQAQIPLPSLSVAPKSPPSPSTSPRPRPQPKTPFK